MKKQNQTQNHSNQTEGSDKGMLAAVLGRSWT